MAVIEAIKPVKRKGIDALPPPTSPAIQERSKSSLTSVKEVSAPFTPSKPKLQEPVFFRVLLNVAYLEQVAENFALYKEKVIERTFAEYNAQNSEAARISEEAQEQSKQVSFWGVLEDLSGAVTGAVSTVFGFSAISAGNPYVGGILIANGVLSISNIAFKHTHVWDWVAEQAAGGNKEYKQLIASTLPAAVGILCTAVGLYGAYNAWSYAQMSQESTLLTFFDTTSNLARGITTMGRGYAESNFLQTSSALSALLSMAELTKIDLENAAEEIKGFHEGQMRVISSCAELLESRDRAIQLTQQPV
ncbi:MAG: hypothetical protein KR126chlam1_00388 [Chlamydiae bacterium]|nr:hypothetical protein [Chlamydiota bacterium]